MLFTRSRGMLNSVDRGCRKLEIYAEIDLWSSVLDFGLFPASFSSDWTLTGCLGLIGHFVKSVLRKQWKVTIFFHFTVYLADSLPAPIYSAYETGTVLIVFTVYHLHVYGGQLRTIFAFWYWAFAGRILNTKTFLHCCIIFLKTRLQNALSFGKDVEHIAMIKSNRRYSLTHHKLFYSSCYDDSEIARQI